MNPSDLFIKPSRGWIYCVTDTVTNKQYVGQTTQSIYDRWRSHVNNACFKHKDMRLSCAIREATIPNQFTIEVLEEVPVEELRTREKYWIDRLKTEYPAGYNSPVFGAVRSATGCKNISSGLRKSIGRPVTIRHLTTGVVTTYASQSEAAEAIGTSAIAVCQNFHKRHKTLNKDWEILHG